jgi:hypothetical protein
MEAIITGDIINSKQVETRKWIKALKSTLNQYGQAPRDWEIFRGDSFQLRLAPQKAIRATLHLKSTIKQFQNLDIRAGIGIGGIEYESTNITESNGSAFVRSGECFDALKKQNIMLKSAKEELDQAINTMLDLSLYISDKWSITVSEIIKLALEKPDLKQKELAERLDKSQSNISEALKRGGFDEIMRMNTYYETQILKLC